MASFYTNFFLFLFLILLLTFLLRCLYARHMVRVSMPVDEEQPF